MKIVVHIGPPKTGSTSIQVSLSADRDRLAGQGIYYYEKIPNMTLALSTLFLPKGRQPNPKLVRKTGSIEQAYAWSRACWDAFEKDVDETRPDLSIISSERFAVIEDVDQFIARLRRRFDEIYVVAYVRDPVALYTSTIQERVRGGTVLGNLPTPMNFEYKLRGVLERFRDVVGQDRMIVRNFARENLVDGDVVADFAAILSRLGPKCHINSIREREGFPASAVAWLLAFNDMNRSETINQNKMRNNKSVALRRFAVRHLMEAENLDDLPKLKLTDPKLIDILRHNTSADCRWINEVFLKDQVPLAVLAKQIDIPKAKPARDMLQVRDWILGYVDDGPMTGILNTLINAPKRGRRNR
jgi:hypothetical protein